MWNFFKRFRRNRRCDTKKIEIQNELPGKDRLLELMLLFNQEAFLTQLTWDETEFILCVFKFDQEEEVNYLYGIKFEKDKPIIDPIIKAATMDHEPTWEEINRIIVSWINKGLVKE